MNWRRLRHREIEPREKMLVGPALRGETQEVLELIEKQQYRRPQREADDDRLRDIARQIAEPQ